MRKQWIAVLSMLGLTGSTVPVQSQVLKGGKESVAKESTVKGGKSQAETTAAAQRARDKWSKTNAEGNGTAQTALHKSGKTANSGKLELNQQTLRQQNGAGKTTGALTPPPPGQAGANKSLTKANNNTAVTKSNNAALTKGNNAALTKANNRAITKADNRGITKTNNNALTKAKTVPQ